ncbi:MAG TPA: hypothetical protein PKA32_02980 [Candidatus Gracilibacteria bacterium]|mgnify:CR=1 FL=1|nr:hypothetical protein [Candidatus Gracilibacteria bacterium]
MERETKRIKIQSVLALVLEAANSNNLHRDSIKTHFASRLIDEAETIHELILAREKALSCDRQDQNVRNNMMAIAFTLSDVIDYMQKKFPSELSNGQGQLTPEIKETTINHLRQSKRQERLTNIRPHPIVGVETNNPPEPIQQPQPDEALETQKIRQDTIRSIRGNITGIHSKAGRHRITQPTQIGLGNPLSPAPQPDSKLDSELDNAYQEATLLLRVLTIKKQLHQIIKNIETMGIPVLNTGTSILQDIQALETTLESQEGILKKLLRLFYPQKDIELQVCKMELETVRSSIMNDPSIGSINVQEMCARLAKAFLTLRSRATDLSSNRERFNKARMFFAKFNEANTVLDSLGA